MKKHVLIITLLLIIATDFSAKAQQDSTKQDMKLDFGITRDNDINIWPFLHYLHSEEDQRMQLSILFPLFRFSRDYKKQRRYSHILPFYLRDSTASSRDLRLLSLYYPSLLHLRRDTTKDFRSFSLMEFAPDINFFQYARNRDGSYVQNNLFFFIWHKSDKILNRSYFITFPVYWHFRNNHVNTHTIFPLYSGGTYHANQDKYRAITPLFWRYKKTDERSFLIFPLVWHKKSGLSDSTEFRKTTLAFPNYWAYTDSSYKDRVFFPIIWKHISPDYRSFTIFPLLSRGYSPDKVTTHFTLASLYWDIGEESHKTRFLFPVWLHNKTYNPEDTSLTHLVLPFYWRFKNRHYNSITVMPFYSKGSSPDSTQRHFAVSPLYWDLVSHRDRTRFLIPFWYNSREYWSDTNIRRRNIILPFYWSFSDSSRQRTSVVPFYFKSKTPTYTSRTLMPIYSKGMSTDSLRQHLAVGPLYWNLKNKDRRLQFLFPIWWHSKWDTEHFKSTSNVILPFYFANHDDYASNRTIFPLIYQHKSKQYQSFTFMPFYSIGFAPDSSRKHIGITPLIWHSRSNNRHKTMVLPLWWSYTKYSYFDTVRSIKLLPVFFSYRSKTIQNTTLFPLLYSRKSPTYNSLTVLPFFSHGKSIDKKDSHLNIAALYWDIKEPDYHFNSVVPLYTSIRDGDTQKFNLFYVLYRQQKKHSFNQTDLLWPIISSKRDSNYNYFRAAPLVWREKTPETSYFTFQPFYYTRTTPEFRNRQFFWQLFTHQHYFDKYKSSNFLWKTLYLNRYNNGDHEFRFIYLFFADVDKEGEITKSFFPFYYFTKDDSGSRSLSVLLYFYSKFQRPVRNSDKFYHEERIFWFIRLRSNYNSLKAEGLIE